MLCVISADDDVRRRLILYHAGISRVEMEQVVKQEFVQLSRRLYADVSDQVGRGGQVG